MQMVNHFSIPFALIKSRELENWTRSIIQTLYVTSKMLYPVLNPCCKENAGRKWRGLGRAVKMIKGLEINPCDERSISMGLYF